MAQYDLIIPQNTSAGSIEYTERLFNIAKGGLLSADTNHVPTVLAAGTNGYMLVRDDNEVTGLKWVTIAAGHTQNTDTGTTNATFTLDSGSSTGKMILGVVTGAANKSVTIQNQALTDDVVLTLPNVTGTLATEAYASGLFAANDAMVYKGTVGTGGTIEKAALEALNTYTAGWTYRVITAGTYFSVVCEVGDLITCIVTRTGSGDIDTDWTMVQTNLDGAVIGPASVTADHIAQFSGTTGKLIKDGGVLGTMAAATATDYVTKALFDANTLLFATSDDTPAALLGTALPPKLWAAAPADKIGTGYSGTAIAGQFAKDGNFVYYCETGGTATNQVWSRTAKATNW